MRLTPFFQNRRALRRSSMVTFSVTSFLLRTTVTGNPRSGRAERRARATSPVFDTLPSPIFTITSPALKPALSAGDSRATDFTSTPSFTPKNSANWPSGCNDSSSRPSTELWTMVTMVGMSKLTVGMNGIEGMGGMFTVTPPISIMPPGVSITVRLSVTAVRTVYWPSRQIPILTSVPAGVPATSSCRFAMLCTGLPLKSRITSPGLRPALDAGLSSRTMVTSAPRTSFSLRALARSEVISATPIPRREPLNTKMRFSGALCAHPPGVQKLIPARTAMPNPSKSLIVDLLNSRLPLPPDIDGAARRDNLQNRSAAVHRPFGHQVRALAAHAEVRKLAGDAAHGIGQFVIRANHHPQIRRDRHGDVTIAGGQQGIRDPAPQEAGDDAAHGGGDAHRPHNIAHADAAGRVLTLHAGSAADGHRPQHVSRGHRAAGPNHLNFAAAAEDVDRSRCRHDEHVAAAGMSAHRSTHLPAHDIAAIGGESRLAAGGSDFDPSSPRGASQSGAHLAYLHLAAVREEAAIAAHAVRVQVPHGLHVQRPVDAADVDATRGGGDRDGVQARRFHPNRGGRPDARREQRRDTVDDVGPQFQTLQNAPRLRLVRRRHAELHGVLNVARNPALQRHRPISLDAQPGLRAQRHGDGARPRVAFALQVRLAGRGQRNQRGGHERGSRET